SHLRENALRLFTVMQGVTRDGDIKALRVKGQVFGIALLEAQVGEAARVAKLFGQRERGGREIKPDDLAPGLRKYRRDIAGSGRDIQHARACLWLHGLDKRREPI